LRSKSTADSPDGVTELTPEERDARKRRVFMLKRPGD
jgi:hypothetical protein